MTLIKLPNGDYIDPRIVRGIRTIVGDTEGPRGLIDTSDGYIWVISFGSDDQAYDWRAAFSAAVNAVGD